MYAATCSAGGRFQPFGAWRTVGRGLFATLVPDAPPEEATGKALEALGNEAAIWTPLFQRVLGLRETPNQYVSDAEPALRHRRFLEIASDLVLRVGGEGPVALFFDDFHLADASTRTLLAHLSSLAAESPLAFVLTAHSPEDSLERASDVVFAARGFTAEEFNRSEVPAEVPADRRATWFDVSRGRPDVLKRLWLLSLARPELKLSPRAGEINLASVVSRHIRGFDETWQKATAVLATVGLPLSEKDLSPLAANVLGEGSAEIERWKHKMEELCLVRVSPGEGDRVYTLPPHLAEALLAVLAPGPEGRTAAARAAAAFAAECAPEELSARMTLEIEAGNTRGACDLAEENVARARWLGSSHDAVAQLTALLRALEREGIESRRVKLPHLFFTRAEALQETGLIAAALYDLEKIDTDDDELTARKLYGRGRAYLRRRYFREAGRSLIEALAIAGRAGHGALLGEIEVALAELSATGAIPPKPCTNSINR